MQYLLYVLLGIAVLLEGSITSLPLVLSMLLVLAVNLRKQDVFVAAFLAGFLLDVLLVRPVGVTSIFFLCMLLLVFLYEKKYEIKSLFFVVLFAGLSSALYLMIFHSPDFFLQVVISTLIAGGLFNLLRALNHKKVIIH
jgi:rod shape-determining protein MreD